MSAAVTVAATGIELHLGRPDPETRMVDARFVCRCGWTHTRRLRGRLRTIPEPVRRHGEACPYARPDQLSLDEDGAS